MKDHIHIEGMPPFNGDWELDIDGQFFNGDELHLIKKISGVRANELEEAFEAGDYDLVIAFAVIALQRAGQRASAEALRKAPVGKIQLRMGDEETTEAGDALPPQPAPTESTSSESARSRSESSGLDSNGDGASQANDQSPTGSPHSDTGVTSDPATSVASRPASWMHVGT